jgi:glycerol uptake facilitator-like aquaporin
VSEVALWRRLSAEFIGSAFLTAVVIGSGIAAQQLSPGNIGLELFENAAATAAGLYALILMVGPVSGAHFNPVVSFVDAAFGGLSFRDAAAYLPTQVAGCITGAIVANLMFSRAAVSISTHHRASTAHFLSEIVATLGLILVIFALARTGRGSSAPAAVGAYIGAAYFFTSSTSFANPAIAVGRMFSDTFAGIAPTSVPWRQCSYNGVMATAITVRNVPEDVRDELAARASRSGRSLQEFLLNHLTEVASRPSVEEVVGRARERARLTGSGMNVASILSDRDAERR